VVTRRSTRLQHVGFRVLTVFPCVYLHRCQYVHSKFRLAQNVTCARPFGTSGCVCKTNLDNLECVDQFHIHIQEGSTAACTTWFKYDRDSIRNNQQMQLYAVNFIPLLSSLYMFRAAHTPIIRSTKFQLYLQPLVHS
jgi:hypothetical protein